MTRIQGLAVAALTGLGVACGPGVRVQTIVSPDAGLTNRRTFRILSPPQPRRPGPPSQLDPMRVNSITNRVLRDALVRGFEKAGYVRADSGPDFEVAYYASTRERLDVTYWNYGYPWRPRYRPGWGRYWTTLTVTQYTEGTVLVDVIDPATKDLLWRGRGTAVVSEDVERYADDLRTTVAAILDRFPAAAPPVISSGDGR